MLAVVLGLKDKDQLWVQVRRSGLSIVKKFWQIFVKNEVSNCIWVSKNQIRMSVLSFQMKGSNKARIAKA